MNRVEYKASKMVNVDFDCKNGEDIYVEGELNVVIVMPQGDIESQLDELYNKHYGFKLDTEIKVNFKDGRIEKYESNESGDRYGASTISKTVGQIINGIVSDCILDYTDKQGNCAVDILEITCTNLEVEIYTFQCEICKTEEECDDDYWGQGCPECCRNICQDCLVDAEDGTICKECAELED